jgi:hypothetical protein
VAQASVQHQHHGFSSVAFAGHGMVALATASSAG